MKEKNFAEIFNLQNMHKSGKLKDCLVTEVISWINLKLNNNSQINEVAFLATKMSMTCLHQ